jgi:hypothetical protein
MFEKKKKSAHGALIAHMQRNPTRSIKENMRLPELLPQLNMDKKR